jgi:CRP/FNR family cyclic AMP-dependent transcriptional regulator
MWRMLTVLEPNERAHVAMRLRPHVVTPGRDGVIFNQGDPADSLHVVEQGHVQLKIVQPDGHEVIYRIVRPGEAFGALALAPGGESAHREATATALEHAMLLTLSRAAFSQLRVDFPAADRLVVDALADDVRQLRATLELLSAPVEQRILGRLLFLAHAYDHDHAGPVVVPTTQAALAALAETSRPTTNLVLGRAERDGLIGLSRAKIAILTPDRLAERANHIPTSSPWNRPSRTADMIQVGDTASRAAEKRTRAGGRPPIPVEQKVLEALLAAAQHRGISDGHGVAVPISQSALATLANTSRQAASLVLRRAEHEGLIRLSRSKVTILRPDRLATRTNHEVAMSGLPALSEPLTERERAVLRYLPSMLSIREIASQMYVSPHTVKTHIVGIYRKLDVSSRSQAVARARQLNLLQS